MNPTVRAGLIAAVGAGVGLLVTFRTEIGRGWLVAMSQAAPRPPAEHVEVLTPTFDGADLGRDRVAVTLVPRITGIAQPTDLSPIPGHPGRWVILSKTGIASTAGPGSPAERWFEVPVATTSELGLLGIAFHPEFEQNGLFFVVDSPAEGERRTRVVRWHTDPTTLSSPQQVGIVLEIPQPYPNHDGGQLQFGPDGYLYVGVGDGGYRGDPHGHGQDPSTLLGSLLRLDVDREPYGVPADNPFVGRDGFLPELWAYGLRNPWRFSFDDRGRLLVADVGQDRLEEVDLVSRGDNLGWNVREGDRCYEPEEGCRTAGLRDPIWTYGRQEGVSVTGGVSWRAPGPLHGAWLFGDFGSGRLWALDVPETGRGTVRALGRFDASPTAFATTPEGGVWMADFRAGAIFEVVVSPSQPAGAAPPADPR